MTSRPELTESTAPLAEDRAPLRPSRRGRARRVILTLVAALVVVTLGLGGVLTWRLRSADDGNGGKGFVFRTTAASEAVTDGRGTSWAGATQLIGGVEKEASTSVGGTANPALYQHQREGATVWAVTVPAPGRYSVDLMSAELAGVAPGARVFDVVADGADGPVVIAADVDLAERARNGPRAQHITGTVKVADTLLRLRLVAKAGVPVVSALMVSGLGKSRLLLDEGFAGSAGTAPDGAFQAVDSPDSGGAELQAYTTGRDTSALDGQGHLALNARKNEDGSYSSAKLITEGRFGFTYGHVQSRLKLPAGTGLWPAFWAVGTDRAQVDWPRSGEYDVMEHLGRDADTVHAHVHGFGDQDDPKGWKDQPVSDLGAHLDLDRPVSEDWHVVSADVAPGHITFSVDGSAYFTAAEVDLRPGQDWPFDSPFYLLLNLAVGGSWGGPPNGETQFPATMLVDYVSVRS